MKSWIKRIAARAISHVTDLDKAVATPGRRYVMAYHRVLSAPDAAHEAVHDAMWVSPDTFERHLRWMLELGDIVSHERLLDFESSTTRPQFAVTFDDGWRDTFTTAFPILQRLNVPALVFLATNAVETGELFWPEDVATKTHLMEPAVTAAAIKHAIVEQWPQMNVSATAMPAVRLAEQWVEWLKTLPEADRVRRINTYFARIGAPTQPLQGHIMSWDEARSMQSAGITFGSHTHNHRILKCLTPAEIESEAVTSREKLEIELGVPITAFCYPNARYRGTEGPILAAAGYRSAFCIDGRRVSENVNMFYVPRFLLSERAASDHDAFRLYLCQAPVFAGTPHDPASPD